MKRNANTVRRTKFALKFCAVDIEKMCVCVCVCVCVCEYTAENILQNKSKTQRDKGSQKYIYTTIWFTKNR